jgi:hypothetical protein
MRKQRRKVAENRKERKLERVKNRRRNEVRAAKMG